MARASAVTSFLEGFNAGWDTVGKVGTAYGLKKLDTEEERLEAGLKADPETGKYSVFGMNFDEAPDQYQISEARNMAQAKVYDRYGDTDTASGLRSNALASRTSGQAYKTSQQAYDQSAELFPGQLKNQQLTNANLGLTGQRTQQQLDQADIMNPLIVELQKLNIDGKGASNRAQELSNVLSEMTRSQREITDPIAVDQARANLANAKGRGIGQDLTNQFNQETMQARVDTVAAQLRSAKNNAEFGELTLGARVGEAVAASQYAINTLDPRVRAAIAKADITELEAAYAEKTFDTRRDSLSTSLDISKQNLERMENEDPHRLQGLIDSNILTALNIDAKTLDNDKRAQIDGINQSYYDALVKGDFTGVEQNLMPFAAQVYNDTNVADDDNKAVQNEDGSFSIVGPDGKVIGSASDILQTLPMNEKRDVIRQAQAYAVASITGDYGAINELYKTEAWLNYYQAKSQKPALTKAQWAIQRFNANPLDRLAIAILGGDNAEIIIEQQLDPAFQLENGGLKSTGGGGDNNGGGNRPPNLTDDSGTSPPVEQAPQLNGGQQIVSALNDTAGIFSTRLSVAEFASRMATTPKQAHNSRYEEQLANRQNMTALLQDPVAVDQAISEVTSQIDQLESQPKKARRVAGQRVKLERLLEELKSLRQGLGPSVAP
jgi:hypothetical protein